MVTGFRKNDLAAELTAKTHTFLSGVSEKLGGKDEGPDPHDLIEAALTACTIITVQMYANRKAIPLESTDVTVKILSEGPETQINRQISFRGDQLTEEQKTRLAEIANKCPIHRLLESNIKIETAVK